MTDDFGIRPAVFAIMGTVTTRVAGPTLEERVARELVPLVRAAAAEEQAEDLRGEASIAVCLAPEPTPRLHSRTFPCWCGGFATAFGDVHLDERIQRGTPGYMFNPDDHEGWFRP